MKKKLLLFPIIGLLLSGCSFEDIMFWKKKDSDNQQNDNSDPTDPGQDPTNTDPVPVSKIILSDHNLEIEELETHTLTFTVEPANATYQTIEWSVASGLIASVVDGVVSGINEGTTSVTVTVDNAKSDTCNVKVNKKPSQVKTISSTLVFDDLGYTSDNTNYIDPVQIDENVTVVFAKSEGNTAPACIKGTNTKKYEARPYGGNTFTISSTDGLIRKIEFVYSTDKPGTNEITTNVGTFDTDTWEGSSSTVIFAVGGESGHRRISSIKVTYEGENDPEEDINLGVKTISQVREYIAAHEVKKNAYGIGVNQHRTVTIKGFALAKIDLKKTTSKYGLDVSCCGKVILADSTGYIACASVPDGDGTTLYGKVDDHAMEDTARYIVTGYISEYLGHPEIMVTSFTWDKTLDVSWNINVVRDATVDIEGFYEHAADITYNCAGHGYGEVLSLNKLRLYYDESDGSGKRYYNFTDGAKNIRVNAYNLPSVSKGKNYDITGIVSMEGLSPIIVAFDIKQSADQTEIPFNYETIATDISIQNLKLIHGSQDDVDTRQDSIRTQFGEAIRNFGVFYKTTGYLCVVQEGAKCYVGISDVYYGSVLTDKDKTMADKNVSLIKNENFWNVNEENLAYYNPFYEEYIMEEVPITVYYVPRRLGYESKKPYWEILLIQDFIDDAKA